MVCSFNRNVETLKDYDKAVEIKEHVKDRIALIDLVYTWKENGKAKIMVTSSNKGAQTTVNGFNSFRLGVGRIW